MRKTRLLSVLGLGAVILSSSVNVSYAQQITPDSVNQDASFKTEERVIEKQKVEQLLKKYNGKVKFIDDNNPDFKNLDATANIKDLADLEKKLDEIDQLFSAIGNSEKSTMKELRATTNNAVATSEISSKGERTVQRWYPVGIGAYQHAYLNTSIGYTYNYGVPADHPGDGAHNYFKSGDSINIWVSGIGSIVATAKIQSHSFNIGGLYTFNTPENPYHHYSANDVDLTVSYTFTLTYGLPTPWGTVGYTSDPKQNSETISRP